MYIPRNTYPGAPDSDPASNSPYSFVASAADLAPGTGFAAAPAPCFADPDTASDSAYSVSPGAPCASPGAGCASATSAKPTDSDPASNSPDPGNTRDSDFAAMPTGSVR